MHFLGFPPERTQKKTLGKKRRRKTGHQQPGSGLGLPRPKKEEKKKGEKQEKQEGKKKKKKKK